MPAQRLVAPAARTGQLPSSLSAAAPPVAAPPKPAAQVDQPRAPEPASFGFGAARQPRVFIGAKVRLPAFRAAPRPAPRQPEPGLAGLKTERELAPLLAGVAITPKMSSLAFGQSAGAQHDSLLSAAKLKQRRRGAGTGAEVISHDDVQAALARSRAESLADCLGLLPTHFLEGLMGGAHALEQVPDPAVRRERVVVGLLSKGGPDGANSDKARRALAELAAYAARHGLADHGLPASGLLVAAMLAEVDAAALAAARGSQGGASVAATVRSGLVFLREHLKLPIDIDSVLVESAAPRRQGGHAARRQAGSAPLAVHCHLEHLAASADESYVRFYARSLLAGGFDVSVRAVDSLRARFESDALEPDGVITGHTTFSKDGAPFRFFAPAEGYLGPYDWWPEHRDALAGKEYIFPAFTFKRQRGVVGVDITRATGWKDAVVPKDHLVASFAAMCALPPLNMSAAEFKSLELRGHSLHGTAPDIAAAIGSPGRYESFSKDDRRELGNWLRLVEDQQAIVPRGTARQGGRARPPGERAENHAMEILYTSGDARAGSRAAQLLVRRRLVRAVRLELVRFGRPWAELPRGPNKYALLASEVEMPTPPPPSAEAA